jgi:HPt (histidine-containing phosphotransfer) domain-containing protein
MDETSEKPAQANLAAALDRLWARFLPEIRERVAVVDAAEQKDAAASAAHKLAGVLGTFSLARGTELARELELQFSGTPASASQLASIASELRAVIDSRR